MSETLIEELKSSIKQDGINGADKYMTESAMYLKEDTGMYYQYFDRDFNVTDANDAYVLGKLTVKTDENPQGNMYTVTVSFENSGKTISRIETKIYDGEVH
jgi:hypothetical protein